MLIRKLTTLAASATLCAAAANAQGPKLLADPAKPAEIEKQTGAAQGNVTVKVEGGKIVYTIEPSDNDWPGIGLHAPDGKPWDLSKWSQIEAKVTNTGDKQITVGLRVDDSGGWQNNNAENTTIPAGETRTAKVIFGHSYGYQKAFDLNTKSVAQVLFFLHGKGDAVRTFTVEDLVASGRAGEKDPIPRDGLLFGRDAYFNPASQIETQNASAEMKGAALACAFTGADAHVLIKPESYPWSFVKGNAVAVTVKNTGRAAVTPEVQVASGGNRQGRTDRAAPDKPLAPGATATIIASFIPQTPYDIGPDTKVKPGTGTNFENTQATAIYLFANEVASLEVASVALVAPAATLPAWLGKQPPVPQNEWGKWKKTFEDNFDKPLDLQKWNIYTDNYWDQRTHFSKDNNVVKDGVMRLVYEKKRGRQNDTEEKETDYACGHADTYGKWTQRYGYYEARMKLPEANGLWPAFWMMPDRGVEHGPEQWKRANTGDGGMELDIMEHLSGWGVYRFNQAFHWDGYGDGHKATGSTQVYVQADKDGFITIGMLWLPGLVEYYSNGRLIGRFESERVCSVQSNLIFYMVSGGWANTPLNDGELADPKILSDFVVDYVRVWQRDDLATPEDGFKKNDGRPKMHSQRADGN